jgi:hypothetical protein
LSYRTNRKTGGVFRTRDYTPSEIESQSRRYICPRCEALFGRDISPATAQLSATETGHEVAGTPVSSFISREELNEHIRRVHPGERLPTREHRRLGRGQPVTVNVTQTNAPADQGKRVDEFYDTRKSAESAETPETPETSESATESSTATEEEETPDEEVFGESPEGEEGSLV